MGTEYKLVLNDITGTHTLEPNLKKKYINTCDIGCNFHHDGLIIIQWVHAGSLWVGADGTVDHLRRAG